jgi:ABC-2 type transport system permease protein
MDTLPQIDQTFGDKHAQQFLEETSQVSEQVACHPERSEGSRSAASGLALDGGNLAAATLSIIPLGLLMAALGYLFSGWLRTAVDTGLLSFLLVIWFFITFIGPGLNWPDTTLRLSAFYYYGTPLLHGLPTGDTLGVLAVGVVALASVRFVRKDIGR